MLVTCSQCGVGYDHTLGRCVACGTAYAPSKDERIAILTADTEERLRKRAKRADVFQRLVSEQGVSETEAQAIIEAARATLREQARQQGGYLVVSGIVLLVIAAAVNVLTLGFRIVIGCLALGGAMLVIGALKVVTGWNITGHDEE